MRVVVIGATGHIGTYLVPRLSAAGHEVVAVSRGRREPYHGGAAWSGVERVTMERGALEAEGAFGRRIAALGPDAVVDLICFTPESCTQLVEALRGRVQHFLHCGTIWVHGYAETVPTKEDAPRRPFGAYGVNKAKIEAHLLNAARRAGFPATMIHPGHIVGPGWEPVNPQGNWNVDVFGRLARGERVALPERGLATLHHVHADDVAQLFERALGNWSAAVGESFHACSPQAVTLRGFAEETARWFGREADLTFEPWETWRGGVDPKDAEATLSHIDHSPSASIEKAQRRLGYAPRYTSYQGVRESLAWLIAHGRVEAPRLD